MSILNQLIEYDEVDVLNIKYKLMSSHPYIFLRGSVKLYFDFLLKTNLKELDFLNDKNIKCFSTNDCHVNNFGFQNKKCSTYPEIHFTINDFDEASEGNPYYDLFRLTSSLYYYIEEINVNLRKEFNLYHNFIPQKYINYFLDKYHDYLKKEKNESIKYLKEEFIDAQKRVNNSKSRILKFAVKNNDNKWEFNYKNIKIKSIFADEKLKIKNILKDEKIIDICKRKTQGVGSSHLDRYYLLVEKNKDVILMELKEQRKPILHYYQDTNDEREYAQIHIDSILKMIENYDDNLKSINYDNKNFILRTSFNSKVKINVDDFYKNNQDYGVINKKVKEYLNLCAITLAQAHLNSCENKKKFKKTMLENYKQYNKEMSGIIRNIYNHLDSSYNQFLREYFFNLESEEHHIHLKFKHLCHDSSGKTKKENWLILNNSI